MFLQHQHNICRQTLTFAMSQARKWLFPSFQRCKCFRQLTHI